MSDHGRLIPDSFFEPIEFIFNRSDLSSIKPGSGALSADTGCGLLFAFKAGCSAFQSALPLADLGIELHTMVSANLIDGSLHPTQRLPVQPLP
jgi:hypothetical protein